MTEEFSRFGLLHDFYNSVRNGERVNLRSVQKELVLQKLVGAICDEISGKASDAAVQQLDGAYVRVKLAKNDKSYGFMYSLLEDMKKRFSIKEYQIK